MKTDARFRRPMIWGAASAAIAAMVCVGGSIATAAESAAPAMQIQTVSPAMHTVAQGERESDVTPVSLRADQWRYSYKNNHWWYWMPGGYWMIRYNDAWITYDPNTYYNYYPSYSYGYSSPGYNSYNYNPYSYSYPSYGYSTGYGYPSVGFGFSWGGNRGWNRGYGGRRGGNWGYGGGRGGRGWSGGGGYGRGGGRHR